MAANPLLKAVSRAMERIAPLRLAESWDNVGLLLESPIHKQENKRVMLTIDFTPDVLSEALSAKTSVVVAYHPPIFRPLQSLTLSNPLQRSLLQCAANGISVYSPHTALDSVSNGVNDWLADGVLSCGEGRVSSLVKDKLDSSGEVEGGEGRLVALKAPVEMETLLKNIKKHLRLSQVQVAGTNSFREAALVRTIAICAGSGGSMLAGKEADVYLTGEMSHHEVLSAIAAGRRVILCGHTNTERGYLPVLAKKLKSELACDESLGLGDGVEVIVSRYDRHPLEFC